MCPAGISRTNSINVLSEGQIMWQAIMVDLVISLSALFGFHRGVGFVARRNRHFPLSMDIILLTFPFDVLIGLPKK